MQTVQYNFVVVIVIIFLINCLDLWFYNFFSSLSIPPTNQGYKSYRSVTSYFRSMYIFFSNHFFSFHLKYLLSSFVWLAIMLTINVIAIDATHEMGSNWNRPLSFIFLLYINEWMISTFIWLYLDVDAKPSLPSPWSSPWRNMEEIWTMALWAVYHFWLLKLPYTLKGHMLKERTSPRRLISKRFTSKDHIYHSLCWSPHYQLPYVMPMVVKCVHIIMRLKCTNSPKLNQTHSNGFIYHETT